MCVWGVYVWGCVCVVTFCDHVTLCRSQGMCMCLYVNVPVSQCMCIRVSLHVRTHMSMCVMLLCTVGAKHMTLEAASEDLVPISNFCAQASSPDISSASP